MNLMFIKFGLSFFLFLDFIYKFARLISGLGLLEIFVLGRESKSLVKFLKYQVSFLLVFRKS